MRKGTAVIRAFWGMALAFLLSGASCAAEHDLVIFHTNDVHGYAFEERDEEGRLTRIGYDRLKAIVDAEPSRRKLLLDAGDVLHGQAFATANRGELMALVLSMAGYDALAVGNHDFDYGYPRLLELVGKYRLGFLAANVARKNATGRGKSLLLPPFTIRSFDDLRVGIFGLSTPETTTSTDPRNVAGLSFVDPIEAAKKTVARLRREEADLIVALTHLGSEPYCKPMSRTLAERVPGIDIVIDGHSHSTIVLEVRGRDGRPTLVASAGAYFRNLGKIVVDRKPGGGFAISGKTIPASSLEIEMTRPDPAMREAMAVLRAELEKELSQVVLRVPFDLDGSRQNVRSSATNLGRLICASLAEAGGADAAFLNGGSIRDSIASGDVTKGQLLSVLPYGNYVFIIEITGKDLLDALNHGLGLPGSGAFPQLHGMEVTARRTAAGTTTEALAVDSVTIGGKALDENAIYILAINDFLHAGGDGYTMFTKYAYREVATLEEAFRDFMTRKDAAELKSIADAEVLRIGR